MDIQMGQEANVINASKIVRSPSKKMKASTWFNISDILFYMLKITNFSPIGGSVRHLKGFKVFGMMPTLGFLKRKQLLR